MSDKKLNRIWPKKRCNAVSDSLLDYIDGTLSHKEIQEIDQHLASCESCRTEMARFRHVEAALVSSADFVPYTGDLYSGFAAKLAANNSAGKATGFRWRSVAPAFALAAVLFLWLRAGYVPHRSGIGSAAPPQLASRTDGTNDSADGPLSLNIMGDSLHEPLAIIPLRESLARSGDLRRHGHTTRLASPPTKVRPRIARTNTQLKRYSLPLSLTVPLGKVASNDTTHLMAEVEVADAPLGVNRSSAITSSGLAMQSRPYTQRIVTSDTVTAAVQPGFSLLVQDDVRGFTSEAHGGTTALDTAAFEQSATASGVKIEVQLDAQ